MHSQLLKKNKVTYFPVFFRYGGSKFLPCKRSYASDYFTFHSSFFTFPSLIHIKKSLKIQYFMQNCLRTQLFIFTFAPANQNDCGTRIPTDIHP